MSIKTANTARLLERLQDYEKMVTKMNMERKIVKRENQFFRVIIEKLQSNSNQCYSFEKEEVYQKKSMPQTLKYNEASLMNLSQLKQYDPDYTQATNFKLSNDFEEDYKFKQKLSVNFCNATNCCKQQQDHFSLDYKRSNVSFILPTNNAISFLEKSSSLLGGSGGEPQPLESLVDGYLLGNYNADVPPVRYSISDSSLCSSDHILKPLGSCLPLTSNVSKTSFLCCSNSSACLKNRAADDNCVVFYKVSLSFKF